MNGLLVTLTLEEPVLANSLSGEPNSAHSLFFIPGGLLRGALIQAYSGRKDSADPDFRRLFLSGETRYLNAYPMQGNARSLPVPMIWQVKRKPARQDPTVIFTEEPAGIDTQRSRFRFWVSGEKIIVVREKWQVNVHTQRDAEKGHATSQEGAVYRYIALPAGMKLQGAILTADEKDLPLLKSLAPRKVLLGKARTAGYGQARLEISDLPAGWRECDRLWSLVGEEFSLTLLSPALLRGENGQSTINLAPTLRTHLGVEVVVKTMAQDIEIAGGFNRTWGLPLPQSVALSAGSVFKVRCAVLPRQEKFRELEETGIGERRAEGFGRLAVNLDFPAEFPYETHEVSLEVASGSISAAARSTAELMLKRRLKSKLDRLVLDVAQSSLDGYISGRVPNSQLSRWRVILRDALAHVDPEKTLPRIKKFIEESKGKAGWEKMSKARVKIGGDTPRLTDWIEILLEEPDALSKALGENIPVELRLGACVAKTADYDLEYRLRLLDSVLAILAKKNNEGGSRG